ncbi:MAG: ArsA family ATPase [Chloroflexota bacterium]
MRIVLYTGKGGVGKTSVAAATALRAAELGYRTVVISTDAAHSLADSFDLPLAPEPIQIATNLWAQELDILHQMDVYWGTIQEWLKALAIWQGTDQIVADEVTVLPGMEELASLLQIVYLHDSGNYDYIVVDSAPTGETLRLLTFPEVARWWLERIFPMQRRAANFIRPMMRAVTDMPLPGDAVFESIQNLFVDLGRMRDLLVDPAQSTIRLVVNPEKMVIKEAQRTFTYLNLFGYTTDAVIVNRVMAPDADPVATEQGFQTLEKILSADESLPGRAEMRAALAHYQAWARMQRPYLQLIQDSFAPVPVFQVPFFDGEVVGFDMLRRLATRAYGGLDPTKVFYEGRPPQNLVQTDGTYTLTVPLPLVAKGAVDLTRTGDDLVVRIGNHKRNLVLPRTLSGLETKDAKLENGELRITFAAPSRADERAER